MSQAIQQAWTQGGSLTSRCQMAGLSRACYCPNLIGHVIKLYQVNPNMLGKIDWVVEWDIKSAANCESTK